MIYFGVFVLWLLGLLACAVLAIVRPFRVIAVYLATTGTLAAWTSFAVSTLMIFLPGFLGLNPDGDLSKFLLIGGYLAGIVGGGVLGVVLGVILARGLTRGRALPDVR